MKHIKITFAEAYKKLNKEADKRTKGFKVKSTRLHYKRGCIEGLAYLDGFTIERKFNLE